MQVLVKICGIRSLEAAKAAINSGADFLGFNFVPTSKRYINPSDAVKIINEVRNKVEIVGVFQDADVNYVNNISLNLELDFVQLHGQENLEYIQKVQAKVIKAITTSDEINPCGIDYFLLDRVKQGKGEMIDTHQARAIADIYLIFLAGGLTPENVTKMIKKVHPFAVDVAGGIETNGKQDLEKIKLFVRNAKETYE